MSRTRTLIAVALAAVVLAGMLASSALNDTPPRSGPPTLATQELTSAEDLREFAIIANRDLGASDWVSLRRSTIPGSERSCSAEAFAAHGAADLREAALAVEASLVAESAAYVQLIRLPALEWVTTDVRLNEGDALVTRRARAFGRAIDPPVLREDRWVVVDREWWLHPLSVAPGCDERRDEIERIPLPNRYEATTPSTFERPLPAGATVGARSANDRSIEVMLTKALRGGSLPLPAPPSPEGYEHIYVEMRVESTDGSQLGSALTFRSATVDGWFLRETGPSMTTICPGTEDTGVTCHLFAGLVLVAEDDPAPRLVWIQRPSHERIAGIAWWRLPTVERDGAPVVRDLPDAELTRALDEAGIVPDVWRTDFSRAAIDYADLSGRGASRSVVGALTLPQYETVEEATERMAPNEPVIALEVSGEARAYPLSILLSNNIVNDWLGGQPVLVAYAPLSNAAVTFERRVGVAVPIFRATGARRFDNLIMYDDVTESWWQQATGEAIVGSLAGLSLRQIPGAVMSWLDFSRAYPNGSVLSIDSSDTSNDSFNPFFDVDRAPVSAAIGELDDRLSARARVIGLRSGGEAVAVPFAELGLERAAHLYVGGVPVVVFWRRGTASPLSHQSVALGRDVGAALAFDRRLDGQTLTFMEVDGVFTDDQTGSAWDITGEALSGPLAGRRLELVSHTNSYWFSWAAFNPGTGIFRSLPVGG